MARKGTNTGMCMRDGGMGEESWRSCSSRVRDCDRRRGRPLPQGLASRSGAGHANFILLPAYWPVPAGLTPSPTAAVNGLLQAQLCHRQSAVITLLVHSPLHSSKLYCVRDHVPSEHLYHHPALSLITSHHGLDARRWPGQRVHSQFRTLLRHGEPTHPSLQGTANHFLSQAGIAFAVRLIHLPPNPLPLLEPQLTTSLYR
jgi:hypothetical protein